MSRTRGPRLTQYTRTKATRGAIRPPRWARRGLTSSPARKWGRRPSAGQYCCLSTVWPLGTTAQQLPQTKSTHPSYLRKLLLGIYLADAHVAKVSARMVTTTLFMCQKIRTTSFPTDEGLAVSSGMRGGGPQVQPQPKPQPTFTQCYYDQFQPSSSRSALEEEAAQRG